MRYVGQGHEVTVDLPAGVLGPEDRERLAALYRKEYRRLYSREGPDVPLEAITWRLEVSAPRPDIRLGNAEGGADDPGEARKGEREIYLPEEGRFAAVPVYDRYLLGPGTVFGGPAVVGEGETTGGLGPGGRAGVDGGVDHLVGGGGG